MEQWTKAHQKLFKQFWNSDLGKESKQILYDLKNTELDAALKATTSEEITARVNRAAGIDEAIAYIESLAK